MSGIQAATRFERKIATGHIARAIRKHVLRAPGGSVAAAVDCVELALKTELPDFRVRVYAEPIGGGMAATDEDRKPHRDGKDV